MALPLIAAGLGLTAAAGTALSAVTIPGFMLFFMEEALQTTSFAFMNLVQSKQWKGVEATLLTYNKIIDSYRTAINVVGAVYKLDNTGLLFHLIVFPHVQFLKASMVFAKSMESLVQLHLGREDDKYKRELATLQERFDAEHGLVTKTKAASLETIKANQKIKRDEIVDDYNDDILEFKDERNDALLEVNAKIKSLVLPFRKENGLFKSELRKKLNKKEISREDYLTEAVKADRVFIGVVTGIKADHNQEKDVIRNNFIISIREFQEKRTRRLRVLRNSYDGTWIVIQVEEKRKKRLLFAKYNRQKVELDDKFFPFDEDDFPEPPPLPIGAIEEQVTPAISTEISKVSFGVISSSRLSRTTGTIVPCAGSAPACTSIKLSAPIIIVCSPPLIASPPNLRIYEASPSAAASLATAKITLFNIFPSGGVNLDGLATLP